MQITRSHCSITADVSAKSSSGISRNVAVRARSRVLDSTGDWSDTHRTPRTLNNGPRTSNGAFRSPAFMCSFEPAHCIPTVRLSDGGSGGTAPGTLLIYGPSQIGSCKPSTNGRLTIGTWYSNTACSAFPITETLGTSKNCSRTSRLSPSCTIIVTVESGGSRTMYLSIISVSPIPCSCQTNNDAPSSGSPTHRLPVVGLGFFSIIIGNDQRDSYSCHPLSYSPLSSQISALPAFSSSSQLTSSSALEWCR